MKQCYLDTEFNAFEYKGQNEGTQEVVEIGAVIMENGSITDTFHTYCRIRANHRITKRCSYITGITDETLLNAPKFPEACKALVRFLKKYDVKRILVYGSADRNMLEATGKINQMSHDDLSFLELLSSIENNFRKGINCGHFSWSIHDLSRILHVEIDREHNALADARTLALCEWKLSQQDIDWSMVDVIIKEKVWKSGYKQNRRVQGPVKNMNPLSPELVNEVKYSIYESDVPDYVKDAFMDDLLTICGLQPEQEERLEG